MRCWPAVVPCAKAGEPLGCFRLRMRRMVLDGDGCLFRFLCDSAIVSKANVVGCRRLMIACLLSVLSHSTSSFFLSKGFCRCVVPAVALSGLRTGDPGTFLATRFLTRRSRGISLDAALGRSGHAALQPHEGCGWGDSSVPAFGLHSE